jgi:hypothetical protein
MARKPTTSSTPKTAIPAKTAAPAKVAAPAATPSVSSPVRNSPIPKASAGAPAKKEITNEMIARRAYEIYLSGKGGSQQDNWYRAERELRGQ